MSVALPAYAYSPVPSYAALPRPNEEDTVEYTPRQGRTTAQFATITKEWRDVTIIFRNQETSSGPPTFGRNSSCCGEIGLENSKDILTITLKLEGRISLSASDCGSTVQKIVDQRRTIWDQAESGRCPSVVGFAVAFPVTYTDQGRVCRLPPTYETICLGSPLLVVKCGYSLTIKITKARTRKIGFWKTSSKTYTTNVVFRPRTRPARPILENPSFFSTVKAAPSEWLQMSITIPTRKNATLDPISCHFMIPSVQTFCFSEDIPFHIQLCGSLVSLREFYGSVSAEPRQQEERPRKRQFAAIIRVFLARQVFVEINGRETWRNITVGEGKLRPIPPVASDGPDVNPSEASVDWEGEVRCKSDVNCASFNISHLVVKDFIILAITPANIRTSQMLPMQHAHPIRLVTDGWTDQDLVHPQDR
ncbi:hypothetical protein DFH07DRAFT_433049 [Mycena maculata]|uniref:Uncharacterized protein n=1 Tax=Mycena maculata TaxID=230809 RepID=A0AAD7KAH3_9AGAR|nr:hypothetical protein DFH07DRAFT_433049 [Mycena maculata]